MRESLRKAYEYLDSGKETLSPAEVGALLGVDGPALAQSAKDGSIGMPFLRVGNRVRIATAGVIRFLQGGLDPFEDEKRVQWGEVRR